MSLRMSNGSTEQKAIQPNIWSTSPITKVSVDRDKMKRVVATEGVEIWTYEERKDFQPI